MCANNSNPVLVSISCITYNHAPFIRECLDGFIMQKTNFSFEVLIHDDASTDGTTEIIKEYEEKYPDIIKPLYEEENQWIKGRRGSAVFNFPRAKGKYIALCEGDDYWTDPLKLQKQVDFLEANNEYSLCCSRYTTNNSFAIEEIFPRIAQENSVSFTIVDFVQCNEWLTKTLTILFRKNDLYNSKYFYCKQKKDMVLCYFLLKRGKGYLQKDIYGVYRKHIGGVWTRLTRIQKIQNDLETMIEISRTDESVISAQYIYNYLCKWRYLGFSFFYRNILLYVKSIMIIYRYLGLNKSLNIMYVNIISIEPLRRILNSLVSKFNHKYL